MKVQRTLYFVTIPEDQPADQLGMRHRSTVTCPSPSKCRSQLRTKPTPLLLSQHASHVGRPSHYHSPQSPAKPHIPRRNSARNSLWTAKPKKTLFGFRKNKPSLGVSVLLNTEVCTGPACSFVASKNKMPLKKVARSWSVHPPGGTMLLMRFSDLMSTRMHSCGTGHERSICSPGCHSSKSSLLSATNDCRSRTFISRIFWH